MSGFLFAKGFLKSSEFLNVMIDSFNQQHIRLHLAHIDLASIRALCFLLNILAKFLIGAIASICVVLQYCDVASPVAGNLA